MLIDSLSTLLLKFIDKERESVIADARRPDNSTDDSRVRNFIVQKIFYENFLVPENFLPYTVLKKIKFFLVAKLANSWNGITI